MTIVQRTINGVTGVNDVRLPVTHFAALGLRVGAGQCVIGSQQYDVPDEVSYTVTPHADHIVRVRGYLTRVVADDSLALIVDEFPMDGSGVPFEFGGEYAALHLLFEFDVPAGAATIRNVDVNVFHMVPR